MIDNAAQMSSTKGICVGSSVVLIIALQSPTICKRSVQNLTSVLVTFWGLNTVFVNALAGMKWKSTEVSCALLRRNDIHVCGEWKSWQRLTWEAKTRVDHVA